MTFDELLTEFRAGGGTAENLRLGRGRFGRGIFPIDSTQPIKVFAPRNLMVPNDAIELHNDALHVRPGIVGENTARIFTLYQQHFGWGGGGREEALALQAQWHALPQEVVASIEALGVLDQPGRRFIAPNDKACSRDYLQARRFGSLTPSNAPVIDLINYARDANGFLSEGGFGVAGTFVEEIVARYNFDDAIGLMITYGFSEVTEFAYCVGISVGLPSGLQLSIRRRADEGEVRDGLLFPTVERSGDVIQISHLKLGSLSAPDLPRGIFRALMAPLVDQLQSDAIFDMIARFNRMRFITFLRTLRGHDGPVVRLLEQASLNQLETISSCVGARPL